MESSASINELPLKRPSVLCIGGHDPSNGAGITVDVTVIQHFGLHAVSVASAVTVQDSHGAYHAQVIAEKLLEQALQVLLADFDIRAIKVGYLFNAAQVEWLARWLEPLNIPLVVDPILGAGGGGLVAQHAKIHAYRQWLLPLSTVCTPNVAELKTLFGDAADTLTLAKKLQHEGVQNVLLTGADEATDNVTNHLCSAHHIESYHWPRVQGQFRGTGCRLASAIAANLALGQSITDAVFNGQEWVANALRQHYVAGAGQGFIA